MLALMNIRAAISGLVAPAAASAVATASAEHRQALLHFGTSRFETGGFRRSRVTALLYTSPWIRRRRGVLAVRQPFLLLSASRVEYCEPDRRSTRARRLRRNWTASARLARSPGPVA